MFNGGLKPGRTSLEIYFQAEIVQGGTRNCRYGGIFKSDNIEAWFYIFGLNVYECLSDIFTQ